MSPEEAKAAMEAHDRDVMHGLEDLRPSVSNQGGKLVIPPDAVDAMRKGDLIAAMKVLRQMKGMGIAEAKAALQQMQGNVPKPAARPHPAARPQAAMYRVKGLSPGEVPRAGAANPAVWILLVAGVLLIFWALFGR